MTKWIALVCVLSPLRLLLGYVDRITIEQRFGKDRVNRQFEPELGCATGANILKLHQKNDNLFRALYE